MLDLQGKSVTTSETERAIVVVCWLFDVSVLLGRQKVTVRVFVRSVRPI